MDKQHLQLGWIGEEPEVSSLILEKQVQIIMPILRKIALECTACMNSPVERLMKRLAHAFGLNWIQAHFFLYLVRESKWNINHPIICAHSASIQDIFCLTLGQPSFQRLILYLSLAIFTTKEALGSSSQLYLSRAMAVCKTFPTVLKSWSKEHSHIISTTDPKKINQIFKQASLEKNTNTHNYQAVVDQILDMALPYSLTRSDEKLQTRKALEQVSQSEFFLQGKPCKSRKEIISEPQFTKPLLIEIKEQVSTDDHFVDCQNHLDQFGFPIQGYTYSQRVTEMLPPAEDDQMEQFDLKMYDQHSNEVIYLLDQSMDQDELFLNEPHKHWFP